jgi:hypothetical protein
MQEEINKNINPLKIDETQILTFPNFLQDRHIWTDSEMSHIVNQKMIAVLTKENKIKLAPIDEPHFLNTPFSNPKNFRGKNCNIPFDTKKFLNISFRTGCYEYIACQDESNTISVFLVLTKEELTVKKKTEPFFDKLYGFELALILEKSEKKIRSFRWSKTFKSELILLLLDVETPRDTIKIFNFADEKEKPLLTVVNKQIIDYDLNENEEYCAVSTKSRKSIAEYYNEFSILIYSIQTGKKLLEIKENCNNKILIFINDNHLFSCGRDSDGEIYYAFHRFDYLVNLIKSNISITTVFLSNFYRTPEFSRTILIKTNE